MLPQPQSRSNSILQPQELQQQQRQQQQQQQQQHQQQHNQQDLNQQQQSQIQQQHLELQPDNTQQYSQHLHNLHPRQVSKLTPQAHSQPQSIPPQQKSTPNNFTNTTNFNPANRPVQLSQRSQQRQLHQNSNQFFQNQYLTQQPTNSKPQQPTNSIPQQQLQQSNQHSQFNQPFQQQNSQTYPVQSQLQYFQQMPPHNNQGQMPPSQQQQQQQQHQQQQHQQQQQQHQQQQQLHQQFSQHLQHPQPSFYDTSNYMYQAIPSNYQPRPQLPLQQQQPSQQPEYYVPVKNPSVSSTSPTTSSSQKERKAKGAVSAAAASPVETHELVILPNFPERLQSILPHPPLSKAPVRPDITVSSTAKRAKRKSKFTPEQDDLIVSLKRKGKSWVEIAEITGVGSYLTARNRYQVIVGQQGNNNSSAWDNNDKIFLRNLLDPAEFEKWRYIASELNKSTNKNFNDFEVREMVRVLFWSNPASFGVSEESIKEALKEKKLTDKTIEQREQQRKKKLSNVVGIDEEHTGSSGSSSSNSGNAATTTGDQRNSYHENHSKNQQASSNIYTKPF